MQAFCFAYNSPNDSTLLKSNYHQQTANPSPRLIHDYPLSINARDSPANVSKNTPKLTYQ
ncbi:hypothetical protein VCRA2110O318_120134 [Vibrio crassostreae]|nr:hypothetical protein VCRA2117O328_120133 [Vibrio crassostreae]CAK2262277.1 hypothetical protein VCRA2110O318_120134 [Vibrio crassostreae]CAK2406073.1 hypothetical protein VCRA2110O319_120135 [Vibrio crassostreae]CAK2615367.1 hypothetical protein VCRA217O317_120133 [Vibrio crassostreae]